ncbi:MAG: hypothetical protein R2716_11425 [Microthrixaceae bacterium]
MRRALEEMVRDKLAVIQPGYWSGDGAVLLSVQIEHGGALVVSALRRRPPLGESLLSGLLARASSVSVVVRVVFGRTN